MIFGRPPARCLGALVVSIAACSGEPASPTAARGAHATTAPTRDFASGSRLHARAWEGDGLASLRDFFDTARGEPCTFGNPRAFDVNATPPVNGEATPSFYCLPLAMARHDAGAGPFSDPECTNPLAAQRDGSAGAIMNDDGTVASVPATYAITMPVDSCAAPLVIHHVGPPKESRPYLLIDGECRRASASTTVYALTDEVPLASFVRATEVAEPRTGSRIMSHVLVAEDGARQTIGGFDPVRSEPVRFEDSGERSTPARWVPARVAFQGAGEVLYGDDQCTKAVPTKIARGAICPLTAVRVFKDACGHADVFEIGSPIDRTKLRALGVTSSEACVAAPSPGVLAFELGGRDLAPVLAPAFVVDRGAGERLRQRELGAGGDTVATSDLIAATTGEPCTPARSVDGLVRCLPSAAISIAQFTDDACTVPAIVIPATECTSVSGPAASARFVRAQAGDEDGARVYERTTEASAVFVRGSGRGGECVRGTLAGLSTTWDSREVDVARFPEMRAAVLPR